MPILKFAAKHGCEGVNISKGASSHNPSTKNCHYIRKQDNNYNVHARRVPKYLKGQLYPPALGDVTFGRFSWVFYGSRIVFCFMGFKVPGWFFMVPGRHLWFQVKFYGFSLFQVSLYGFSWFQFDFSWFQVVF